MISEDKQYEYIGTVITDRIDRARDAFKLFLQLFSIIVGGAIWLSMHEIPDGARYTYIIVSDALVLLLTLVTGTMVYEALRGWWGYREALSSFDGGKYPIPPPKRRALASEVVMMFCMVAGASIFIWANPFAIALPPN